MNIPSNRIGRWPRLSGAPLIGLVLILVLSGVVLAAETVSEDTYRLPAGEIINDDLYVTGGTIFIDGTVNGDLVATGGYIEINGEVTEDVLAAGGGIVINGTIGDDVRVGGGGVTINGSIGDDLFVGAGGAGFPGMPEFPINVDGRMVQQGLTLAPGATVGGDAYLGGGSGTIAGTVGGDLFAGMGTVNFAGAVGGNATINANRAYFAESAQVAGTLTYDVDEAADVPAGVATEVEQVPQAERQEPEPSMTEQFLGWILRVARALAGLLILGWILLKLAPTFTAETQLAMDREAGMSIMIGIVVAVVAVPVAMLLVALAWLFWGAAPAALATAFFLFGLLGVLWFISPAITGLWLGRKLLRNQENTLLALVLGVIVLLLAARAAEWIPLAGWFVGWLIMLFSFVFGVGAIVRRRAKAPAMTAITPEPPALDAR